MGNFVQPEHFALYLGFIKGIREDLGRNLFLHIPGSKVSCANCRWDPINKRSTGMYSPRVPYPTTMPGPTPFIGGICPVCNGTGQFSTETTKVVLALIRWLKVTEKRYVIQGLEAENDFRIKCDIKYIEDFKNARIVVVDGVPAEVTTIVKRGLRDLTQVVVFLKRSEYGPGRAVDVGRY